MAPATVILEMSQSTGFFLHIITVPKKKKKSVFIPLSIYFQVISLPLPSAEIIIFFQFIMVARVKALLLTLKITTFVTQIFHLKCLIEKNFLSSRQAVLKTNKQLGQLSTRLPE